MARTKQTERNRNTNNTQYELATFGASGCGISQRDVEEPASYATPDSTSKPKTKWLRKLAAGKDSIRVSKSASSEAPKIDTEINSDDEEAAHVTEISFNTGTLVRRLTLPVQKADREATSASVQIAPRRGRPRTRSLACDLCGSVYAHRASILRHRRVVHKVDAHDRPLPKSPATKSSSAEAAKSPSPRRSDGQRFYGGKRPPGQRVVHKADAHDRSLSKPPATKSSSAEAAKSPSSSSAEAAKSPTPRRSDGHRFYGGKRPPGQPAETTKSPPRHPIASTSRQGRKRKHAESDIPSLSRRCPVDELITELDSNPTAESRELAEALGRRRHWTLEDIDIAEEHFVA